MKRTLSILLALVMALGLCVPALAAAEESAPEAETQIMEPAAPDGLPEEPADDEPVILSLTPVAVTAPIGRPMTIGTPSTEMTAETEALTIGSLPYVVTLGITGDSLFVEEIGSHTNDFTLSMDPEDGLGTVRVQAVAKGDGDEGNKKVKLTLEGEFKTSGKLTITAGIGAFQDTDKPTDSLKAEVAVNKKLETPTLTLALADADTNPIVGTTGVDVIATISGAEHCVFIDELSAENFNIAPDQVCGLTEISDVNKTAGTKATLTLTGSVKTGSLQIKALSTAFKGSDTTEYQDVTSNSLLITAKTAIPTFADDKDSVEVEKGAQEAKFEINNQDSYANPDVKVYKIMKSAPR